MCTKDEDLEICEGCGKSVSVDDMSGVMEMWICNTCEHGEPTMQELLKEALNEANTKLLKRVRLLKKIEKRLLIESIVLEDINKEVESIGLPLSMISLDTDEYSGAMYATWEEEVENTEDEISKEKRNDFNSVVHYILQPLLFKNGFKRISYDHRAFEKFTDTHDIVILSRRSTKADYKKTTLYDLYLDENYKQIEMFYSFFYVKKEQEKVA